MSSNWANALVNPNPHRMECRVKGKYRPPGEVKSLLAPGNALACGGMTLRQSFGRIETNTHRCRLVQRLQKKWEFTLGQKTLHLG